MLSKLKKYGLTNKKISKMFGYKSTNAFEKSTARDRIKGGIEAIIKEVENYYIGKLNS